jgi:hypothetical protein
MFVRITITNKMLSNNLLLYKNIYTEKHKNKNLH